MRRLIVGTFFLTGSVSAWTQCTASFNTSATDICSGNTVNFTNTSTGATNFSWKVDGVEFSTTVNAAFVFNTAGNHTVELTIVGPGPCTDSEMITISVNQTPGIDVSVFPTTLYENDCAYVTFTTNNVLPGATYTWNFCNADMQFNSSPFYYQWDSDGTFCVCVQLENPNSCEDNDCQNGITVLFFDALTENDLSEIELYPNPAVTAFVIDLGQELQGFYTVSDLSGRYVSNPEAFSGNKIYAHRQNLPAGTYLVHIYTESQSFVKMLVLN